MCVRVGVFRSARELEDTEVKRMRLIKLKLAGDLKGPTRERERNRKSTQNSKSSLVMKLCIMLINEADDMDRARGWWAQDTNRYRTE